MGQYDGIGGSYVIDPATGEATLVERTYDPNNPAPRAEPPAPTAEPTPTE